MALIGLVTVIPGLLIITYAYTAILLYLGLFFLGVGSSMVIPCLTSLLTFYTPLEDQGRSVGIFRSMGALARAIGPISASIIYFRYGSAFPYLAAALLITIPIAILSYISREQIT
jgi:MFS family permease